jgi:hypothetical protein
MAHTNLNSLDHFYSQTCLRYFSYSPGHVFMYRKKEKFEKSVPINSICCERGGDICESFENKFGLRQILDMVEPTWNIFIDGIKNKSINEIHAVHSQNSEIPFLEKVSLFISYLRCLSPTILRLLKEHHEEILNKFVLPLSATIENNQMDIATRELIQNGDIKVTIGNKSYYKNEVINFMAEMAQILYNKGWKVLINTTDTKFITSDTPFISLANGALYLPLTPEYALIFKPFPDSNIEYKKINRQEVKNYNKEIVKWASDQIISSTDDLGISKLVNKYRNYEVKNEYTSIKEKKGEKIFFQHRAKLKEN